MRSPARSRMCSDYGAAGSRMPVRVGAMREVANARRDFAAGALGGRFPAKNKLIAEPAHRRRAGGFAMGGPMLEWRVTGRRSQPRDARHVTDFRSASQTQGDFCDFVLGS